MSLLDSNEQIQSLRLMPTETLAGRFRIERRIAGGGMGEVYEALDLELNERIAVKTIRPEIAGGPRAIERFRREISLARKVTHPNVCRIFDLFSHRSETQTDAHTESAARDEPFPTPENSQELSLDPTLVIDRSSSSSKLPGREGLLFLTMEFLSGRTLSEHLKERERLSPTEALSIVRQIALGLNAAHEAGVVHRDLKCGNIMLVDRTQADGTAAFRAVVTDFGIARRLMLDDEDDGETFASLTGRGELVGSPQYMAPEQVTSGEITPRTDVYALGVLMYRMTTGSMPFNASSVMAGLFERVNKAPPSPRTIVEDLDPRWEAAILKCLATKPEERFASTLEILDSLEERPFAEPAAWSPEIEPPQRNFRKPLIAGLSALSLTVVFLLARLFPFTDSSSPSAESSAKNSEESAEVYFVDNENIRRSVAVLGFQNLSGKAEDDWPATALSEFLSNELAVARDLRVVARERIVRMRRDLELFGTARPAPEMLEQISRHLDSRYVVGGSYFAGDESLRLDLWIHDVLSEKREEGTTLPVFLSETVSRDEFLALVELVGSRVRQELSQATDLAVSNRGSALPATPRSAKLYTEGLIALRSSDALRARDLLQEAVDADPDYALVYEALSQTYAALGYDAEAKEQIRLARERAEGLPPQERSRIAARELELNGDTAGAVEIYDSLFQQFPDDLEHGLELLRLRISTGEVDAAQETLVALQSLPPLSAADPRIDLLESDLQLYLADYRQALAAAVRAAEKGESRGGRWIAAQARLEQSGPLTRLDRFEEAEQAVLAALETMRELGDRRKVATALRIYCAIPTPGRDPEESLQACSEALNIAREIGSNQEILLSAVQKANVLLATSRRPETFQAADLYEEASQLSRRLGQERRHAWILSNLALARQHLGEHAEALRIQREALKLAEESGNQHWIASIKTALANMLIDEDPKTSTELLSEALRVFQEAEDRWYTTYALQASAVAALERDDLDTARRILETAQDLDRDREPEWLTIRKITFARVEFAGNAFEAAADLAGQAGEELEKIDQTLNASLAHALAARAQAALGRADLARREIDSAQELIKHGVAPMYAADIWMAEALTLDIEGRSEEALTLLADQDLTLLQTRQRLESRLVRCSIEAHTERREAALKELSVVAAEAQAKGFLRIARHARETLASEERQSIL